MKFKWGLILLLLFALSSAVHATGINVYINNGAIQNKDGGALADANYFPYKANLEFFTSLPAPDSSAGRLAVDEARQYTLLGTQNKYQFSALDGGTMHVRVWNGAPITENSYYGKTSNAIASGTTLPYDFYITSLKTSYKAAAPYQPFINNISEASDHPFDSSGTPKVTASSLKISSEQGAGNDGIREVKSIDWHYGQDRANLTAVADKGATLSLNQSDLVPGATYFFQTVYNGYFGAPSASNIIEYKLGAGGGAGGITSLTVNLRKVSGGFGINSIGIPFSPPFDVTKEDGTVLASAIYTFQDLVQAINAAGANVTAAAYWDDSIQQLKGVVYDNKQISYVTKNAASADYLKAISNTAVTAPSVDFAPSGLALIAGRGYYVSVDKDITIILRK